MNNALAKLIMEALKRADGYTLPESTLVTTLKSMVVPTAEDEDFSASFRLLIQRDMVGFKKDDITDERHFFLKSKGEAWVLKH